MLGVLRRKGSSEAKERRTRRQAVLVRAAACHDLSEEALISAETTTLELSLCAQDNVDSQEEIDSRIEKLEVLLLRCCAV